MASDRPGMCRLLHLDRGPRRRWRRNGNPPPARLRGSRPGPCQRPPVARARPGPRGLWKSRFSSRNLHPFGMTKNDRRQCARNSRGPSSEQGGDRGCRHRLKDLRAIGCGRGVQGAAVFTRLACDHAELPAFGQATRAGHSCSTAHQDEADPAEDEAQDRPARSGGPGKKHSGGRAGNSRGAEAAADSRIKATKPGINPPGVTFGPRGPGDVIPQFSRSSRITGFRSAAFERPSGADTAMTLTRVAASVIGVTSPKNASAYEAAG